MKLFGARTRRRDDYSGSGGRDEVLDGFAKEVTAEELREFLEADGMDVEADPVFRESLRDRLWDMVQARTRSQRAARKD